MRFVRKCGICFTLLALMALPNRAHGQQSPKLTTVNYGTITISALHWPFLIAEQEGFLQKEGIDFEMAA
jgi:ABC-type nitrate/sulfonate/bicarbonate transport system substrate-binding protein